MAKLKPLSKDEELSAIPVDEPVLVELEPPPSGEEPEEKPKPTRTAKEPKSDDDDANAGVKALQTQMAEMQRARDADVSRLAKEAADAKREAAEARQSAADTEADYVASGLQNAQSELKSVRASLKAAYDAGDTEAMADAQERIGRLSGDIREYERAAAVQSQRKEVPAVAEAPKPADFNATLNAMNLMPTERDWFTRHPDALVDQRQRTRLDAAYYDAMDEKLTRGSPEYFDFVEQRLGYKKPEPNDDEQEERTPIVAAPVSRDSRSAATGRVNNNQVTLSPQEREMARNMGISDIAYAKGKQQLAAAKNSNPEKYGRTR